MKCKFIARMNKNVKKMSVWDVGLIKWSVLFFTLFLVALWPVLASLPWWAYLIPALILMIRPARVALS